MEKTLNGKTILLIISGGIAAYKSLELIRLFKKDGAKLRAILTKGGAQFVTPLSVSALCEEEVYQDLWSLKDESEMGHIRLSREADLVLVAPASANMIAKIAHGMADDLASTTLLANKSPVMIAPAMNNVMWEAQATQSNIQSLKERGVQLIGPEEGDMACGEYGYGRMFEPEHILTAVQDFFLRSNNSANKRNMPVSSKLPLKGRTAIVTSGPTFEAIDPVRFIGNRSSGKQGHTIATALQQAGADVTYISGPTALPAPKGVHCTMVETASEMKTACENALPADIAICAAAVCDWQPVQAQNQKLKKRDGEHSLSLEMKQTPDILRSISNHAKRPTLVIGFAAETQNVAAYAQEKLTCKGCDWILANDVGGADVFGAETNHVHCLTASSQEDWGPSTKHHIAERLTQNIIAFFDTHTTNRVVKSTKSAYQTLNNNPEDYNTENYEVSDAAE